MRISKNVVTIALLLFISKALVCVCVCLYIYIYIYNPISFIFLSSTSYLGKRNDNLKLEKKIKS